eukprot:1179808-Prorocentrum_minimum.AAC.1
MSMSHPLGEQLGARRGLRQLAPQDQLALLQEHQRLLRCTIVTRAARTALHNRHTRTASRAASLRRPRRSSGETLVGPPLPQPSRNPPNQQLNHYSPLMQAAQGFDSVLQS